MRYVFGLVSFVAGASMLTLATSASARSLADIKKSGELRVCSAASQEDQATQIAAETALFAKKLGVKAVVKKITWDEQFQNKDGKTVKEDTYNPKKVESGECDILPNLITKNEWRAKKLGFVTYFPGRMMIIVNKAKKSQYKSEADLAGKSAVLLKDSSYQTWAEQQNKAAYASNPIKITLMSVKDGLNAVNSGQSDFTILDGNLAIASTHRQVKDSIAVFPIGATDEICWGFHKDNKDLQDAARKFLADEISKKDSELNGLWKSFYGMSLTDFVSMISMMKK